MPPNPPSRSGSSCGNYSFKILDPPLLVVVRRKIFPFVMIQNLLENRLMYIHPHHPTVLHFPRLMYLHLTFLENLEGAILCDPDQLRPNSRVQIFLRSPLYSYRYNWWHLAVQFLHLFLHHT